MFESLNIMTNIAKSNILDLDSKDIIKLDTSSSSKGNQSKYYNKTNNTYIKEQFYFQGKYWKDYMVENISGVIGRNIHSTVRIIEQEICYLSNGLYGCVSSDFAVDKRWIPFAKDSRYRQISKNIGKSFKVFEMLKDIYKEYDVIIDEYLIVMIIIDFLLANEDRHFNNFGVLEDKKTGKIEIAPLFDFGIGLFEHDKKYLGKTLHESISLIDGKPFNNDLRKPVEMLFNIGLKDKVYSIFKDIKVPDRILFPTDLSFEYFRYAYDYLFEEMNK